MSHLYIICIGRQDYPKIMTILLILDAICLAWQRGILVFRTNGKVSLIRYLEDTIVLISTNRRRLWRPRHSLSKQPVQIIKNKKAQINCTGYGEDAIASYYLLCQLTYKKLNLYYYHSILRTNQKPASTNVVLLQCKRGTFEEQKESF